MATPTLEAHINDLIDQRLRQMQTAYPAEIVSFDQAASTATVKPLFVEAWRGPSGERLTETVEEEEDAYVENVLVAFPRAGNFRITFPVVAGDTGLVIVTKYSLDVFRGGGGAVDPGDLTKFGMTGSVFFPVNLTPDADPLDGSESGSTDIYLGEGATGDFLALQADVDDIKIYLDDLKDKFNNHVHTTTAVTGGGGSPGVIAKTTSTSSATYTPTLSADVKVESN
jgi:hypothetical protein